MKHDISVIIPTYNASDFILDSLKSVKNQTFLGDLEVIIIDDCSTDNTRDVIAKFVEENKLHNFRVINLEKNRRQGYARNLGVKEATGKYVLFLDGDDILDTNALSEMYKMAVEYNCDVVACDWIYFYNDKDVLYVNNELYLKKRLLVGEECEELLTANTYFSVNKLYKKDFLLQNNIRYGEGYIYEDYEFYVNVAQSAQLIGLVPNPYYKVRISNQSTTKTNTKSTFHLDSYKKAVKSTLDIFNPRKETSYYHLYKHLVYKAILYSERRAPFGHKYKTLKSIVDLLNSKNKEYHVPKNVIAFNHFLFRRKYVQKGKIISILMINYLHKRKKLDGIFKFLQKVKRKITHSKIGKSIRKKRRQKKIQKFYKQPIDNNIILFMGFDYRYIGNSKYFFDYLININYDKDLYFVTKNKEVPKQYRISPRSLKFYNILSKAKIVFVESWVPLDFKKREGQVWIQLWHGTPFKKLFFDSNEFYISSLNRNHKKFKTRDITRWDYLLSDSNVGKDKFKSAFVFNETNIWNIGYPRVQWLKDNINNQDIKLSIRKKLNIPMDKNIVLYVPTWRDYNYRKPENELDFSYLIDFSKLNSLKDKGYIIINKAHSMEKRSQKVDTDFIYTIDENIVEMQELLLIADYVISDYSSVIFDAFAVDIPVYLFVNDFEKYKEARGVYEDIYLDLKDVVFYSEEQLVNALEKPYKQYITMEKLLDIKNNYTNSNNNTNFNEILLQKVEQLINI